MTSGSLSKRDFLLAADGVMLSRARAIALRVASAVWVKGILVE